MSPRKELEQLNPDLMNPNKVLDQGENFFLKWLNDPTVAKFAVLLLGFFIIHMAAGLFLKGLRRSWLSENPDSVHLLSRLIRAASYLLSFLLATSIFRDKLGGLSVAFGVAGAGIAFALQEVIASLAGWVAISLGGFYKIGDRVRLGGIKGDVIEISLLRTTLMELGEWVDGDLYNGRIVRITNSYVFKEPVYNYSGGFPFLWDEIKVPFKYGCDWKHCREILIEVSAEVVGKYATEAQMAWRDMVLNFRIENASVDPLVTMICNDNWIEFTLRYVVDYKSRRGVKDQLFEKILERFDAEPQRLGMASSTFHLVQAPPFQVKIVPQSGVEVVEAKS